MSLNSKHHHFILHKPYGYLSQLVNNQLRRRNKRLLSELYDFPKGTMAIGRLDESSEGLLFLTTDGKVSEYIRSHHIDKEYYVQLDGIIDDHALIQLQKGVSISVLGRKYKTQPAKAFRVIEVDHLPIAERKIRDKRHGPTCWVSITVREGKFRQIRKMTASIGFPTLRLIRVRIGSVHLKLLSGQVEEVSAFKY